MNQSLESLLGFKLSQEQLDTYNTTKYIQHNDNKYILSTELLNDSIVSVSIDAVDLVKLIKLNPKLGEQYCKLCDLSFEKELSYRKGNTIKRLEDNATKSLTQNSKWVTRFYYDFKKNKLVASINYILRNCQTYYHVSLYALFTNPEYQRQGYANNLIQNIIEYYNIKSVDDEMPYCPIYDATIYVWNKPSFKLFSNIGFYIYDVRCDEAEETSDNMKYHNITKLEPIIEYNGQICTPDYYYIMCLKGW